MYNFNNYCEAKTLNEAISLLAENPNQQIIAGGTDILIKMHSGKLEQADLLSIHGISSLQNIEIKEDGTITIGSLATFSQIAREPIITKHIPVLAQASLSKEEDVKAFVKQTIDTFGTVDVLVNNAAAHKAIPVKDLSLEDWNYQIDVNLTGTFLCSREVLPSMMAQKSGKIINISSISALLKSMPVILIFIYKPPPAKNYRCLSLTMIIEK
jgi:hypothetical protein